MDYRQASRHFELWMAGLVAKTGWFLAYPTIVSIIYFLSSRDYFVGLTLLALTTIVKYESLMGEKLYAEYGHHLCRGWLICILIVLSHKWLPLALVSGMIISLAVSIYLANIVHALEQWGRRALNRIQKPSA
jgi:hypothetical protein